MLLFKHIRLLLSNKYASIRQIHIRKTEIPRCPPSQRNMGNNELCGSLDNRKNRFIFINWAVSHFFLSIFGELWKCSQNMKYALIIHRKTSKIIFCLNFFPNKKMKMLYSFGICTLLHFFNFSYHYKWLCEIILVHYNMLWQFH